MHSRVHYYTALRKWIAYFTMRLHPIKVVQSLLVLSIFAGIYMRFKDPDDSEIPFDNVHADPEEIMNEKAQAAADHRMLLLPDEKEVLAAKVKREDSDRLREADRKEAEYLRKVEGLEKIYPDAEVPSSWASRDWSGLPSDVAAIKTEADRETASMKKYAFNAVRSAKIPLRRPLRDMRSSQCQLQRYPPVSQLPTVSVVICFAEEMWSSLFRTVWSVLDRTPKELLKEIILVNDASTADWLQDDLTNYLQTLPQVVRMITTSNRSGLIRSRTVGANVAIGDIIVFLDSHCEATDGWYEPIAARIKELRTTIVCPTIDSISDRSLDYNAGGGLSVGGFHWTLDFTWIYRPLEPGKTAADPLTSPTMAGGLFAVDRKYWGELGGYDLEMEGWGGENLELSFRVWTCGGSQEIHPCSHVGHIFRSAHPYDVPGGFGEVYTRNSARLAATWLDEYADVFFRIRPSAANSHYGDVSDRLALRKQLDCKPFKWYMDKFFPDKFVPLPSLIKIEGQFKNGNGQCIDTYGHQHIGESLGMYGCHGPETASMSQGFLFTHSGQIRIIWDLCWDITGWSRFHQTDKVDPQKEEKVLLSSCTPVESTWRHNEATKQVIHIKTSKCLTARGDEVVVAPCKDDALSQQWSVSGKLNA